VRERLDITHRFSKQRHVLFIELGLHATSGEGLSVYFPRLLKAPSNIAP
jgi:hypothetical protein